jgi:methyl-accepting chemotaxis protein
MTTKRNQRHTFWVASSIQYRFFAISISYSFIIVCFFVIAVFVPDMIEMRDQSLDFAIRSSAASRILSKNLWVWPAILSLIIVLGLHSFLMFKKIAGPLYRFKRAFEELGRGNLLLNFKLRKKDYLHREEEAFNDMVKVLSERLGSVQQSADWMIKSIGELEQTVNNGSEWTNSQIARLRTHRQEIEKVIKVVDYFRTEGGEKKSPAPERNSEKISKELLLNVS